MTPEDRFDRIEATLQANGQAIAKLGESQAILTESVTRYRAELTTQIEHSQAQTIEAMRDMQTEILRGIQSFAAGNHARMHRIETSDTATNARIEALEQRVLSLETRLHPPQ